MSDKKQTPAQKTTAPNAARHIKDIPLEERLPDEFKPLYGWWKANGNFLVITLAVLCALYAGYKYYKRGQERKAAEIGHAIRESANQGAAARILTLETLVQQHGSARAAYNAYILLGKALYDAERYEDALAAYRSFLKKAPSSKFADIARVGEAESLEALNQPTEALAAYDAFLKKAPADNFWRPLAEMGRARAIMLKGDKAAALLALEETEARYAGTGWSQRIEEIRGVIERYEPGRAPRKRLSLTERLELGGFTPNMLIPGNTVEIPLIDEDEDVEFIIEAVPDDTDVQP